MTTRAFTLWLPETRVSVPGIFIYYRTLRGVPVGGAPAWTGGQIRYIHKGVNTGVFFHALPWGANLYPIARYE